MNSCVLHTHNCKPTSAKPCILVRICFSNTEIPHPRKKKDCLSLDSTALDLLRQDSKFGLFRKIFQQELKFKGIF